MWIYEQQTGKMFSPTGLMLAQGYSGAGQMGMNNTNLQNVPDIGPIPVGTYSIDSAVDTVTHGPCVLALTPSPENEMFGRSGFLIHGDSIIAPGTASKGCIVMPRFVRDAINASDDRTLQVVALLTPAV